MTAPATTTRAGRVPPGLAELHQRIDEHEGTWPADSHTVAEIFGVTAKTVTGWATARQLAGLLLSLKVGWRFSKVDVKDFATRHYYDARRSRR